MRTRSSHLTSLCIRYEICITHIYIYVYYPIIIWVCPFRIFGPGWPQCKATVWREERLGQRVFVRCMFNFLSHISRCAELFYTVSIIYESPTVFPPSVFRNRKLITKAENMICAFVFSIFHKKKKSCSINLKIQVILNLKWFLVLSPDFDCFF